MLEGILIFQRAYHGSRSEGVHPFLYRGYGNFVKVVYEGDIPMMHSILCRYDGKYVAMEGEFDLNEVFVATSVTVLETVELISPPAVNMFDEMTIVLPGNREVEVNLPAAEENPRPAPNDLTAPGVEAFRVVHGDVNILPHNDEN